MLPQSAANVSLAEGARTLLLRNRRSGHDGVFNVDYSYTCPSAGEYPWQWFWDSCFHAIVLSYFDVEQAKAEIRTLLCAQRADGFMPHVVHWGSRWPKRALVDLAAYGQSKFSLRPKSSALVQPPVLAQAVLSVAKRSQDSAFLHETLPGVRQYYLWLAEQRDPDADNLVSVISPYETGMDQLPIYDELLGAHSPSALEINVRDRFLDLKNLFLGRNYNLEVIFRRDAFTVEDVMFNCVYAQGLWDVARLCDMEGDAVGGEAFRHIAQRTEAAILEKCYDAKAGRFWSLGTQHERPLRKLTVASLFPLILETIDQRRVDELAELIRRVDAFGLPFPVPSVAKSEPSFRPGESFAIWRGATWVNTNWFIVKGLERHGHAALARSITQRTIEMVSGQGFREFYNPLTGKGAGARDFGWSTLVVDMM